MKALVTGGAGFIGSHLARRLIGQGVEVVVLDDLRTGSLESIEGLDLAFVEGSILEPEVLHDAMRGVSTVFHLAAITSVPASFQQPEETVRVNVDGTRHVLETASKAAVRRVVVASSSSVYGDPETIPIPETARLDPRSPYARSKVEVEQLCAEVGQQKQMSSVSLRIFNVYGPGQTSGSVMARFLEAARQGTEITIYGDGDQVRDFIHIDDVVEAFWKISRSTFSRPLNIGSGIGTTIRTLARWFVDQNLIRLEPRREGDIGLSCADIGEMRRLLDFQPQRTLRDDVEAMMNQLDPVEP